MEYQINNQVIPKIAVGTWAWGTGMNGSKMVFGTKNDEQTLNECFQKAYNDGFTLWDTAAVYGMGNAERILSQCIQDKPVILSDKYTPSRKYKKDSVLRMLDSSVKRFQGRIPDIYWLHSPKNLEENLEEMCQLLEEGKIASIGVSNVNKEQLLEADLILKRHGLRLAGVQNHYSLLYRNSEQSGIIDWCYQNKIPFFSYMVLEQGALTGRFNGKHGFPFLSRRSMAFSKTRLSKIEYLLKELKRIGDEHGLSIAETATSWAISKRTVPIIGVTKVYQAEALKKMSEVELTTDEIKALEVCADHTGIHVKASWE